MPLTAPELDAMHQAIVHASTVRDAATAVRLRWPGLRALVLDPMDMRDETPAATLGRRKLYLASTDGHCWAVTGDPAQASAVILTEDPS